MQKLKALLLKYLTKYREIILYVFFGGCTTLISIGSYWVLAHPLAIPTVPSTIISNALAILFAYVTNRIWVFQSRATGTVPVLKEMGSFFASRLGTLLLDLLIMYVFVDLLHWNDMIVKIVSNIIVIVLNYVLSKLLVFRDRKDT